MFCKKSIIRHISLLIIILLILSLSGCNDPVTTDGDDGIEDITYISPDPCITNGIKHYFTLDESYFCVYNGVSFDELYIKGVNMGSGKPGYFPGELGITEEEYLRWFGYISEMNANTVRVYTVMMPAFYDALWKFNSTSENKIYLFQGVWYDEGALAETSNVFDPSLHDRAISDVKDLVDIIHGDAEIEKEYGHAYGEYTHDISAYVIGWILGIESDTDLIGRTNDKNPEKTSYSGTYLSLLEGSAFEAWLCEFGDTAIAYETDKYSMQRPVSFSNWPTADTLTHNNETEPLKNDTVSFDVEKFTENDAFIPGLFASYHIYPYYPDFLKYEHKYINYVNKYGDHDPYMAYLLDLAATHSMPVLVAEYGLPTSRGATHVNNVSGFDQGNLTETEQGDMLAYLSSDINDAGYAGGLIFAWQDEWFKRTWNTMDYSSADRRAYWSDVQTCEQKFGLMTFEPSVYLDKFPDGDLSEWVLSTTLLSGDGYSLCVDHDAEYLYIKVKIEGVDFSADRVLIPFDITPKSGSTRYDGYTFTKACDFICDIQGEENSHVYVQSHYDNLAYQYGTYAQMDTKGYEDPYNPIWNPIYLCLSNTVYLPEDNTIIPFDKYETGALVFGNANPDSSSYNSLADFYYDGEALEIRIPWLLLNFRDPSTLEVQDDYYATGSFTGLNIDGISIGLACGDMNADMKSYTWDKWDHINYKERLKDSYYIIKDCFDILDILEDEQ